MGLKIHPLKDQVKTKIGKLNDGNIDVLGVIYRNGKLLIRQDKLLEFIHNNIDPLREYSFSSSRGCSTQNEKLNTLIERLNYRIAGWGGQYSFCNVANEYKKLDKKIEKTMNHLLDNMKCTKSENEKDKIIRKIKKLSEIKITSIQNLSPRKKCGSDENKKLR